ncbi:sugar ABC transporter substrate-binding protein [Nucisporomicrobium flavum]|uniref:sugar ABC transporter substrate-binding protein n=1 Tax=Nucisporomicrobium flavum TaxID=2785915 RepID=UPI003C30D5F2
MDGPELATTISIVTTTVALMAAATAVWQALLARRQAASANRAADAAVAQADAAQQQALAADRSATVAATTLEMGVRQEQIAAELNAQAQANKVSAWWGPQSASEGSGIYFRNGSEAPVFQVHATVLGADDGAEVLREHLGVLPPTSSPLFLPLEADEERETSSTVPGARRVCVTFTDEAGVRWMRDPYGPLRRFENGLVVVATDLPRAAVLKQFADEFRAAYGVTLTFEVINTSISDALEPLFAAPSRGGGVVDALIGAHDWIGGLARRGLIEPIALSKEHREAFRPWTLNSLSYDGRLYGLPTTLDTTALIRNLDLAPASPVTMEDLIASGNDLRRRKRVTETLAVRITDEGDPFQLWPLFASAGGSLFGRSDGVWDAERIDLDSPASISAFDRLRSLGERGDHLLRCSMDRPEAFDLFASGRTAYLISSSDGLEYARRAGLRVAVSPVPPFAGAGPARGMSLVHSLFVAKGSAYHLLAHDLFSDYLTHRNVMEALSRNVVCPIALRDGSGQDRDVRAYQEICEDSDPMPTFRGMRHVWEVVGKAQAAAIRGAPAEGTARAAAREVALSLESARTANDAD